MRTTYPLQMAAFCVAFFTFSSIALGQELQTGEPSSIVPSGVDAEKGSEPVAEKPAEQPPASSKSNAQEKLAKAKKLAKIQRHAEAITLFEEAFVELDDPEILRMLAESHVDAGQKEKGLKLYDEYLADARVPKSSKDFVTPKRDAVAAELGAQERKLKEDHDDDGYLGTWRSHGQDGGVPGRLMLALTGSYMHNQADTIVHGSYGGGIELGGYVAENLSISLGLGLDAASWDVPGLTRLTTNEDGSQSASATLVDGLRPDLEVKMRWHFGGGFWVGPAAGGDLVVFEAPDGIQKCDSQTECVDFEEGLNGIRSFGGATLGYRTELADPIMIALELRARYYWLYAQPTEFVETMDNFQDNSFSGQFSVGLHWNL